MSKMSWKTGEIEDIIISKIKDAVRVQDIVDEVAGDDPKKRVAVIKKILEMESKGVVEIVEKPIEPEKNLSGYPPEIVSLRKSLDKLLKRLNQAGGFRR